MVFKKLLTNRPCVANRSSTSNKWGSIVAEPRTGKTTEKGVWAGGDIVTGAAAVILTMGAGRKAADSIQDYLTQGWSP